MTLNQIRSMFQPGQQWKATNSMFPKMNGIRTLVEKKAGNFIWKVGENMPRAWMPFPQASQVIESREGFLSFKLFTAKQLEPSHITEAQRQAVITLERVA